jgi:glutathione S-transferase
MSSIQFVDVAAARAARGIRLIVSGAIPSPWSEAAKGLFHIKGIPVLAVRFRRADEELAAWTGAHNVPVLLNDDDPPRTGWAEILSLAERIGGRVSLVPANIERRVRLFGLVHELAGEGGVGYSSRLLMIHGSLATGGAAGFPLPVARYLAPKYGYAAERIPAARARIGDILRLFDDELERSRAKGHGYVLGAQPSALDIYLAAFLIPLFGVSEADCPGMRAELRVAFTYLNAQVKDLLTPTLEAHRAMMLERHLGWPITL